MSLDTTKILTEVNYKNAQGEISSYTLGGGSKLYEHIIGIDLNNYGDNIKLVIINNTNEVFDFSKLIDFLSNETNKSYPITTGAGKLKGITVLYMGQVTYNTAVGGNPFFVQYCYLKKETQDITINEQTYTIITDCTLEETTYRTSRPYRVTDTIREL